MSEKKVSKSDLVTLRERVKTVRNMMLQGLTRYDICHYASETWGVSDRQAERYMHEANKILDELNMIDAADNLKMVTANMWSIYRDAVKANDHRLKLDVLKEICKIKGLNHETVMHIIDDKRELSHMTDEELDSRLDEAHSQH